jgi:hypothetical protein
VVPEWDKSVVNPKRDLSNGFLVAEILQRYFPTEIELHTYENGTRLSCKNDNWEQIYAFGKKKGIPIQKADFDPVIHCVPGAAMAMLFKLFQLMTKRNLTIPPKAPPPQLPPFARPTASWRLKDNEIHRVVNDQMRLYRAIEVLDIHNETLGRERSEEASRLFEMRLSAAAERQATRQEAGEQEKDQQDVQPIKVRHLGTVTTSLQEDEGSGARTAKRSGRAPVPCAAAALDSIIAQQPQQPVAKLATDIFRTFINPILQEQPELLKGMDPRKDMFTSFMEQCLSGLIPESLALRVFETFATRCLLVVEPLQRSPAEFHKVWGVIVSALDAYPETSPLFDALCAFVVRLGELMRAQDSALTHQLFLDVQLASLADILADSAGKRESIAEVMMAFIAKTAVAHLSLLRALKEYLKDLGLYCLALAVLIVHEAQYRLLDDNLLDLYVYYAMVALHNAQPKVRVAGIALALELVQAGHVQSVWPLIPDLAELAADPWWEVQAQLLMLATALLVAKRETEAAAVNGSGDAALEDVDQTESLLTIITSVFHMQASKNVLQVGLVHLVRILGDYPSMVPNYIAMMLAQPELMRKRLFADAQDPPRRLAYVMGTSSRLYEEYGINLPYRGRSWPALAISKGLAVHLDAMGLPHLELVHAELLLRCIAEDSSAAWPGAQGEAWIQVYKDVQPFVLVALVDAELHTPAKQILRRFWLTPALGEQCLASAKDTFLQALTLFYGALDRAKVGETELLGFLEEVRDASHCPYALPWLQEALEEFRDKHPQQFAQSRGLGALF